MSQPTNSLAEIATQLQTLGASLSIFLNNQHDWDKSRQPFHVSITYTSSEGDKLEIKRSAKDFETAVLGAYAAFRNIAQKGIPLPLLAAPLPNGWTTIEPAEPAGEWDPPLQGGDAPRGVEWPAKSDIPF